MRLRSIRVLALATSAPLLAVSCTSDLPAPDCYNDDCQITGASATGGAGDISIDCADIPDAALLAMYDYTPMISGGDGTYSVTAQNLPTGLIVNASTGQLTGIPEMAGMASIDFQVTDSVGATGSQICEFTINDALDLDDELLLQAPPYCVRVGATLNDFVVAGTGDGTAIACDSPGGLGNGDIPAGISVNADTCAIEGTLMETRLGTYVWIVRGTQSGREVFLPYCVTQDTPPPGSYDVSVDHSGLAGMGVDATLVPIVRRFNPAADFNVGGGADPRFEVIDATACGGNACFYGFAFGVNASPFAVDQNTLLNPNGLIDNMAGDPIGFFHELQLSGPNATEAPTFAEQFGDRPWLVNIDIDYCLNEVEAECVGTDNIRNNGNAGIEMGVVMFPE